ncbi:response regulator transcription factor [Jatrophihabitans sp.]|uniref:response regulator transcription factor n=1 Tax=Jatrophihabitans sp. TaxID=1932789 RepID=UPI0030C65E34|nr:two-component system, OmpR family, response regulator [Jatrophihabitans sp.]
MSAATPFFASAGEATSHVPATGERLLVVDDEVDIAALLATGLRFVGFDVRTAHSGAEALTVAAEFRPHLLLLDVMLPDINGFELCRQLRRDQRDAGVIFLTARNRTEDAVAGLAIGADDYINKPFSLDEVVARVRAVLRRLNVGGEEAPESVEDGVLRFADLELDEVRHEVRRGNSFIDLSPTEFALLRYLLQNSGHYVSKPQILTHVWSYDFQGAMNVVENYISSLRKQIDCFDPPLIHTSRGVGYSLRLGRTS